MKTKKKIVRLTEGQLHNIINESVRRVLNEGKTVNNKPGFKEHTYATPDLFMSARKKIIKNGGYEKGSNEYFDAIDNYIDQELEKHNDRRHNRMYVPDSERHFNSLKYHRGRLIKMLRHMGMSLEEYNALSNEEKWDLEDQYDWMQSGGGRYGNLGLDGPDGDGDYMGTY